MIREAMPKHTQRILKLWHCRMSIRSSRRLRKFVISRMRALPLTFAVLCIALLTGSVATQDTNRSRPGLVIVKPSVKLVDQFGVLSSEDRSARFDNLFQEISRNAGSVGYVFLYCGRKCRYGEIEAHQRGIEIKIALRNFDRSRIVVVNAGFREKFDTELWLAASDAVAPLPKSTLNIRYIEFAKTSGPTRENYDCCDDYSELWKNLKP